tara:strand:+ start:245 stop:538 length:294 start_codon:yes stop_codon:yes gene_type:complete
MPAVARKPTKTLSEVYLGTCFVFEDASTELGVETVCVRLSTRGHTGKANRYAWAPLWPATDPDLLDGYSTDGIHWAMDLSIRPVIYNEAVQEWEISQ